MLHGADGAAEPGVVADRQQQVAVTRQFGGKFRIDRFVTDVAGNAQPLGLQQRLLCRAAGEVGHRQIEEGNQPAQQVLQGYVFTERHQFLLEVGALALAQHGDGVVEAPFARRVDLAQRHAGDQRCLAVAGDTRHHRQVAFGVFLEYRYGGFRPDNQLGRGAGQSHVAVQGQLRLQGVRVPLEVLLDIALNGRYAQRLALGMGPGMLVERLGEQPGAEQQTQAAGQRQVLATQLQQVAQQGGRQRQDE